VRASCTRPKVRVRDVVVPVHELRMIPGLEQFRAKVESHRLAQDEVLLDADNPVARPRGQG
jgi:hypothetical protein